MHPPASIMSHPLSPRRRATLVVLAGVALLALPAALRAQSAEPAAPRPSRADSAGHRLAPVIITAPDEGVLARLWRGVGARAELGAMSRENRALLRTVHAYDRRIAMLERRLAAARAPRDSIRRDIARLDSATATTRATRVRLEERLRALERGGAD
jgi:hypothetical protein